jgi:hypothetical protein
MGRRRGRGQPRVEVPTTPVAVALGHLAAHVDDLAVLGKLPEDATTNSVLFKLLDDCCSGGRLCCWDSCLRYLLFVIHSRLSFRWAMRGMAAARLLPSFSFFPVS